jgi:amicoumacin kinase
VPIGGYHNDIYRLRLDGNLHALRLTPYGHRTRDELEAEIKFLRALLAKGIATVQPVRIPGHPEIIDFGMSDGTVRFGCMFEWSPGKTWTEIEHDKNVHISAGAVLAKIHSVSKLLLESNIKLGRRLWYEKGYIESAPAICEKLRPGLGTAVRRMLFDLRATTPPIGEYGLIHGDFLLSNYLVHNDGVTVLDFDDLEYGWYAYDIAVNLYYDVLGGDPLQAMYRGEYAQVLLSELLQGYLRHVRIPVSSLAMIEKLMRQREIGLLTSIVSRSRPDALSGWAADFVKTSIPRIEAGVPIVKIDYTEAYEIALEAIQ